LCARYSCQPRCISKPHTNPSNPVIPDVEPVKGEKGEKGDRGEKGEKGDRGEAGPAGKDGLDGIQKLRISSIGNLIAIYGNGREEVVGKVGGSAISSYEIVKRGE
jgi:hypothetical protein